MVLKVTGVHKGYGGKQIIHDVSFCIEENEIVALVGPNGSGKTTLFNTITSLSKKSKGAIYIQRVDVSKNHREALEHVSFMQDSSVLYPELTGRDHLQFIAKVRNKTKEAIENVISELKIQRYVDDKVFKYSTGMKQHLLFALVLLSEPTLLIMDEPLNGLDPSSVKIFRNKMLQLRESGTTILFSSHILSEIDKVADRILFISNGRIIDDQIVREVETTKDYYVIQVSEPDKALVTLTEDNIVDEVILLNKNELHITIEQNEISLVLQLLQNNKIVIQSIEKSNNSTENLYERVYGVQENEKHTSV